MLVRQLTLFRSSILIISVWTALLAQVASDPAWLVSLRNAAVLLLHSVAENPSYVWSLHPVHQKHSHGHPDLPMQTYD